jgi:hypothetical protein
LPPVSATPDPRIEPSRVDRVEQGVGVLARQAGHGQLGDSRDESLIGCLSDPPDEEDSLGGHSPADEREHLPRWIVDPVRIVDEDDQRALRARV